MALLQGGAYPGLDAVEGLPRRGDPVRQSKLNYGQVCSMFKLKRYLKRCADIASGE
jgi:hypothetical protein